MREENVAIYPDDKLELLQLLDEWGMMGPPEEGYFDWVLEGLELIPKCLAVTETVELGTLLNQEPVYLKNTSNPDSNVIQGPWRKT